MKTPFLVIVVIVGVIVGAAAATACGDGGGPTSSGAGGALAGVCANANPSLCERLCCARARPSCNLGPSEADCDSCSLDYPASWCTNEYEDYVACRAALQWYCNFDGEPDYDPDEACVEPQWSAVLACWYAGPAILPDLSDACATACQEQATLPCASTTCEQDCAAAVADGAPCRGAWAALFECSAGSAVEWECNDGLALPVASTPCYQQKLYLGFCSTL